MFRLLWEIQCTLSERVLPPPQFHFQPPMPGYFTGALETDYWGVTPNAPSPLGTQPMSETQESPGDCPHCETRIPASRLLIEYDASDGPGVFAECPDCEDVVTPT